VLVEAVDNLLWMLSIQQSMNGLTDFGAVLGQMAAILNDFFVVHYSNNKLCKKISNQTSSLNFF
jgi:hypothetical protein